MRTAIFDVVITTNVSNDCKINAINVLIPKISAKQSSCNFFATDALFGK